MSILLCTKNKNIELALSNYAKNFATLTLVTSIEECFKALDNNSYRVVVLHHDNQLVTDAQIVSLLLAHHDQSILTIAKETNSLGIRKLISLGLNGAIAEDETNTLLDHAMTTVLHGGIYASKIVGGNAEWGQPKSRPIENTDTRIKQFVNKSLTSRQYEVVAHVAKGLSNKQVADTMDIGEGTVRVHLVSIFKKLAISNRHQLIAMAAQVGW